MTGRELRREVGEHVLMQGCRKNIENGLIVEGSKATAVTHKSC